MTDTQPLKDVYYVKFDVNRPDSSKDYYQFELSCCVRGSKGDISWGWPCDRKIILLEGDNDTYGRKTIELITHQAELICRLLNRG